MLVIIIQLTSQGKTTIFKQIVSHFSQYQRNDEFVFSRIVSSVIWSLARILEILKKSDWHLNYDKEEQKFIDEIIDSDLHIDPLKLSIFLKKLLMDDEFNHIVKNHHQHFLSDSILYQFPNFENFVNLGVVTKQDYLQ
jgi:hypothetical protein